MTTSAWSIVSLYFGTDFIDRWQKEGWRMSEEQAHTTAEIVENFLCEFLIANYPKDTDGKLFEQYFEEDNRQIPSEVIDYYDKLLPEWRKNHFGHSIE